MKNRRTSKIRIRYAVVGLGHIAQVAVLPAFKTARNSELFALVSDDAAKLHSLGKKYKIDHLYSYDDYSRALSNVDAVYIALPNHLHREYAVRAAAAGVHVLCEKPMAPSSEDCHAMINAAHQNRTKLMIAYRLHFEAGNLEAINCRTAARLANQGSSAQNLRSRSPTTIRVSTKHHIVEEARSTTWASTASMPPAICSAPNPSKSQPYLKANAKDDLQRLRRWSRLPCAFPKSGWPYLPAASEPPM